MKNAVIAICALILGLMLASSFRAPVAPKKVEYAQVTEMFRKRKWNVTIIYSKAKQIDYFAKTGTDPKAYAYIELYNYMGSQGWRIVSSNNTPLVGRVVKTYLFERAVE